MLARKDQAMRLWRTVRHLRPVQIYWRPWFRLYRPHADLRPAPSRRERTGPWQVPARREPSLVGARDFRFLNRREALGEVGWDCPDIDKLWVYNQHYFDDLNASNAGERAAWHEALITDWVAGNRPGVGTGWEPYPTSLRVVNWIKWSLGGNRLPARSVESLAVQARWLMRRLEWHILGNHLFANAKALVFAGLYFQGSEARAWLDRGLAILAREIDEQVLADGGQFELSPMYHALAVEDMLDLVNLAETFGRTDLSRPWRGHVPGMLRWLAAMSHPDGRISFFNDAAFGVAPEGAEITAYAARLGFAPGAPLPNLCHLADSGYARLQSGPFTLIADLARIGPDYLPGHAHADTLSFELSHAGQRVFVNSGTSEYGAGSERQRQRGTSAHNTVLVEDQNSSEVWAGFRVGRRARSRSVEAGEHDGKLYAAAAHDGYRHLPGSPLVSRRFELDGERLVITDSVQPACRAQARFHLHPAVGVSGVSTDGITLDLPDGQRLELLTAGGQPKLEQSTWHPEFGRSEPNACIVLPLADGSARLTVARA